MSQRRGRADAGDKGRGQGKDRRGPYRKRQGGDDVVPSVQGDGTDRAFGDQTGPWGDHQTVAVFRKAGN